MVLFHRARRRIAKQREEAAVPLSKIVEVRKKVYGDLKVSKDGSVDYLSGTKMTPWFSALYTTWLSNRRR